MSGSNYGSNRRDVFHPPLGEQERHHAKLDFDRAEDAKTPEAKLAWVEKWGRRVADHLWTRV